MGNERRRRANDENLGNRREPQREQIQPDEGRFDWFTNREDAEKQAESATVEMMNDGDYRNGDGFSVLGFDQNGDCDDSPITDFYIEDERVYDRAYRKAWGAEE